MTRHPLTQNPPKQKRIKLLSILRAEILLRFRIEQANFLSIFGGWVEGLHGLRGFAAGREVELRGGVERGSEAGEEEVRVGGEGFGGDGVVFEGLPVFEFGVEVFDYEGVFSLVRVGRSHFVSSFLWLLLLLYSERSVLFKISSSTIDACRRTFYARLKHIPEKQQGLAGGSSESLY